MRPSAAPSGASSSQPASLGFNLAGIAVLVLLLAVGAAYVVDILGKNSRTAPPDLADHATVAIAVGGKELTIPTSWFRYGEQLRGGFVNEIDLHVVLRAADGAAIPVDVTLLPRSRVRPSNILLDGVYLHQFGEDTLSGVPGLVVYGDFLRHVWFEADVLGVHIKQGTTLLFDLGVYLAVLGTVLAFLFGLTREAEQ